MIEYPSCRLNLFFPTRKQTCKRQVVHPFWAKTAAQVQSEV